MQQNKTINFNSLTNLGGLCIQKSNSESPPTCICRCKSHAQDGSFGWAGCINTWSPQEKQRFRSNYSVSQSLVGHPSVLDGYVATVPVIRECICTLSAHLRSFCNISYWVVRWWLIAKIQFPAPKNSDKKITRHDPKTSPFLTYCMIIWALNMD